MNEASKPILPVPSSPVSGLPDLRSRHSALLQRQESKDRQIRPSPGEMLGFLVAVRQFGRLLPDFDQRETAQGIMDYWTAKLLGQVPQVADSGQSFYLDDFDEAASKQVSTDTEAFARQSAAAAVARADDNLKAAPPRTRELLQRLLLRLFRLKENSLDVYPVPLLGSDPILKDTDAARLLGQLVEAGVVRQVAVGDDPPKHELQNPRFVIDWGPLKQAVTRRRGFRELARGWDKGGRQTAALLDGGLALRNAELYSDLDSIETEFLACSRRHKESQWKKLAVLGIAIVLMVAGIMIRANTKLAMANAQLKAERDKAETRLKDVNMALEKAQLALKSADELRSLHGLPDASTNTPEYHKQMERFKRASALLDSVKRDLNTEFSPKYSRTF